MQSIHHTLMGILPLTTSDRIYNDPKRKQELDSKAKELAELTL